LPNTAFHTAPLLLALRQAHQILAHSFTSPLAHFVEKNSLSFPTKRKWAVLEIIIDLSIDFPIKNIIFLG